MEHIIAALLQIGAIQTATRQTVAGVYGQDSIWLTSRLTIDVGLRWDPALVPYDYFNRGETFSQANFDAGIKSTVFPNAPAGLLFYGDPGVPRGFQRGNWRNFRRASESRGIAREAAARPFVFPEQFSAIRRICLLIMP
jgi:outer membrane receptor protein involved in Fe transport